MRQLSVHCERLGAAAEVHALAALAVREAQRRSHGILCGYALAGDVLSLGRYQVVPERGDARVALVRRASGGRAAPLVDGFLGVVLALPERATLLVPGSAIGLEQIPN